MSPVSNSTLKKKNLNISRVFAIIPAAGLSTRMESDTNKQIMEIDGTTVIERTLGAFQKFADDLAPAGITLRAVVVTSPELIFKVNGLIRYNKFEFVSDVVRGGNTRMESVWNGIEALADLPFPPNDNDIVFIHDGARCLVDQPTLERCLEGALQYDICAAAVPVKSTIKQTRTDILDDIPTMSAPAAPAAPAVPSNEPAPNVVPDDPMEALFAKKEETPRETFKEPEPYRPQYSSLAELMASKKAEAEGRVYNPNPIPEPEPEEEEEAEPSPFAPPFGRSSNADFRLEKVSAVPVEQQTSQKKQSFNIDFSRLPSLAEKLGKAVMSVDPVESMKSGVKKVTNAAGGNQEQEKEEAPVVEEKKPYVRPDSPFKRIDVSAINVDEEPEVVEEPEEDVAPSPFKPAAAPSPFKPAAAPSPFKPAPKQPVSLDEPVKEETPAYDRRNPMDRPIGRPVGRAASNNANNNTKSGRPMTAAEKAAAAGGATPAATRGGAAARKSNPAFNNSPEVVSTPDRNELMEVQTPQVFRFDKLIKSYVNGIKNNLNATDDTSLAEAIHLKVHLVEGSYTNIKITTQEDIAYAEMILKRQAAENAGS